MSDNNYFGIGLSFTLFALIGSAFIEWALACIPAMIASFALAVVVAISLQLIAEVTNEERAS